jgi:hypothetical protein
MILCSGVDAIMKEAVNVCVNMTQRHFFQRIKTTKNLLPLRIPWDSDQIKGSLSCHCRSHMSLLDLITEPFLIIFDNIISHTIFGAFANIGFAGTSVHSCTRQAFAGLLNALLLNQMTLLCIFSLHCKDTLSVIHHALLLISAIFSVLLIIPFHHRILPNL